jgi:ATP-dependent Clp protease ATP-binding subunit ClpA
MFDLFAPEAIKAMTLAEEESRRLGQDYVGAEHILLGIVATNTGAAADALQARGVTLETARNEIDRTSKHSADQIGDVVCLTPSAREVLELSLSHARKFGARKIGAEHLLLSIIQHGQGVAIEVLTRFSIDLTELRAHILSQLAEDTSKEFMESGNPTGYSKLQQNSWNVVARAQEEARRLGQNFVGSEQILLGLLGERTGIVADVMRSTGLNLRDARAEVKKITGRGTGFVAVEIPFTPRAKRVLELSWDEARQLGHNYIGAEHLLLGLIRESGGVAAQVLQALSIDLNELRRRILKRLDEET